MPALSGFLAYKYVTLVVMLAEINYCSQRLELPVNLPIRTQDLNSWHVSRPQVKRFGGSVDVAHFGFGFGGTGQLRFIMKAEKFPELSIRERHEKISKMVSLVGTNEAYELAVKWLRAIEVDVENLERQYPPRVEQRFFYPDAIGLDDPPELRKRVTWLPVFEVNWGTEFPMGGRTVHSPPVSVTIFGPTKELLALRQDEIAFARRPKDLLKNEEKLLAISDEEFGRMSSAERENLVRQFAAVSYPPSTNAPVPAPTEKPRQPPPPKAP